MKPSFFLSLAWKSLTNRRATAILTVLTVALSVTLFLGVQKIEQAAEQSFESTISGTDIIVGARTGSVNLLLYAVFRIGEPSANISWESYQTFANAPGVEWTVPLSLGDTHKGFRVLGTDERYFEHFRYGGGRALAFAAGDAFADEHDTVIGAQVARTLGYSVGDEVTISHGIISAGFAEHAGHPFIVSGILAPTGTPVDRTMHVSLGGLEAVHEDINGEHEGDPEQISAFLVGLSNPTLALKYQRDVNTYEGEALLAIMPGIALAQLWEVVGAAQTALSVTATFVVITGLLGLLTAILTSLNERRREVAVLRAAGAQRGHIFSLLVWESTLVATLGAALGAAAVYGGLRLAGPWIEQRYGVPLSGLGPSAHDLGLLGLVVLAATLLGMVPAWRAYRNSLADGLTVKL
ncbi:ABC transporter permease [Parvularcula sp. LCG005]|uniref:ABC transporter permease n=1 Tax=Parvularcula sp. LCG005 TaxID=3078805 RepID=UPI002942D706|nr:FtsX-like permease family protein [Parvularcula sp. LCG005]WOI52625.1 FtsX-like permease family protein [Parvularcula sp. LCG005]